MKFEAIYAVYGLALSAIWLGYALKRRRNQSRDAAVLRESVEAGLTEPNSLHPDIDPVHCVGCGACAKACPEGTIIGIIDGKATLINPTECIGHGACAQACPTQAISLVFGTATRGVDIPQLSPDFQTNVPGIFIAGELGGMGLVRNAIEQGKQAMDSIRKLPSKGRPDCLDVLIVGSGPAGFSAALAAKEAGLNYLVVEQDDLGGTVFKYPRDKLVMTQPATLPIVGKVKFSLVLKEKLLEFWQQIEREHQLRINYHEQMSAIETQPDGSFVVQTSRGSYATSAVLLSIGRRGTPRKLEIPGESLPKVVYHLIDAEQYRGSKVLVVGGGDSALEGACSIAEEANTSVTLSYRSDAFSRAKTRNRERVRKLQNDRQLEVLMSSNVLEIHPDRVIIETPEGVITRGNDAVIICAGGILPTGLLKSIGVAMETKYGTA